MKHLSLIFLLILFGSHALASIQAVSNLSSQRVVINAYNQTTDKRQLLVMNLKTYAKEKIALPNLDGEEIIGMVLFKDHMLMISQWTTGGGKDPRVHQYSFKDKKWLQTTEVLSCLSFDTVEVKKSTLKLHCEDQSAKMVKLDFRASSAAKVIFPVETGKDKSIEFKVTGGTMFNWDSLEVKDGDKPAKVISWKSFFNTKKADKKKTK